MYCECGCGNITNTTTEAEPRYGYAKGQHRRYCKGHAPQLKRIEYLEKQAGYISPCWIWQMYIAPNGYGQKRYRGKAWLAHRLYYERTIGPIPEGFQIDHLCKNRSCVNPDHLEPVTHAENGRRGAAAKLDHEKVNYIKKSSLTNEELAQEFDVHPHTIRWVREGRTWT